MTSDQFQQAIKSGQGSPAALQFVAFGGDVNTPLSAGGLTPLQLAVEAQNIPMIEALFNLGADLDAHDAQGWTPLHRAVDIDLDTASQTAGMQAGDFMRALSFATAEALITLGADDTARDAAGRTPRDLVASYGADVLRKYDESVDRAQRAA